VSYFPYGCAFAAAVLFVGAALAFSPISASSDHYTFELVDREVKQGSGATILVRLVDERTGKWSLTRPCSSAASTCSLMA
jgi:hypothetical protein